MRYCVRPPFALERLHASQGVASLSALDARLLYRLAKPTPDGRTVLSLSRVMYDRLGTREPDKAFFVAEAGHIIPTVDVTRETLNWFDRYLGPAR